MGEVWLILISENVDGEYRWVMHSQWGGSSDSARDEARRISSILETPAMISGPISMLAEAAAEPSECLCRECAEESDE